MVEPSYPPVLALGTFQPPVALTDDMTWTIDFTGGTLNFDSNGPHLKIQFLNAQGGKQGSLLSENLPLVGTPPQNVPEPATGILLLSALGTARLLLRRGRK
jgi:hypothetical protein